MRTFTYVESIDATGLFVDYFVFYRHERPLDEVKIFGSYSAFFRYYSTFPLKLLRFLGGLQRSRLGKVETRFI